MRKLPDSIRHDKDANQILDVARFALVIIFQVLKENASSAEFIHLPKPCSSSTLAASIPKMERNVIKGKKHLLIFLQSVSNKNTCEVSLSEISSSLILGGKNPTTKNAIFNRKELGCAELPNWPFSLTNVLIILELTLNGKISIIMVASIKCHAMTG